MHCGSARLKLIHGLMPVRCPRQSAPEGTHAYTLDEAETISNALIDHPPCQLVFCLATFLGLRPGEISALQWDDVGVDAEGLRGLMSAVLRGVELLARPKLMTPLPAYR